MIFNCCVCGCKISQHNDVDFAAIIREKGFRGPFHWDYNETEWNVCGPCFVAKVQPAIEAAVTTAPPTVNKWGPQ